MVDSASLDSQASATEYEKEQTLDISSEDSPKIETVVENVHVDFEAQFAARNKLFEKTKASYCRNKPLPPSPNYYLANEKYKIAACATMKTGLSTFFNVFYWLKYGAPHEADTAVFDIMNVEKPSKIDKELQHKSTDKFTRILNARHPLLRLYSGWNEHMRISPDGKLIGWQWKLWNLQTTDFDLSTNHTISWNGFVKKLVADIGCFILRAICFVLK